MWWGEGPSTDYVTAWADWQLQEQYRPFSDILSVWSTATSLSNFVNKTLPVPLCLPVALVQGIKGKEYPLFPMEFRDFCVELPRQEGKKTAADTATGRDVISTTETAWTVRPLQTEEVQAGMKDCVDMAGLCRYGRHWCLQRALPWWAVHPSHCIPMAGLGAAGRCHKEQEFGPVSTQLWATP